MDEGRTARRRTDLPVPGGDFDVPNVARMYDAMLGGTHNFAVDRCRVAELLAVLPEAVTIVRAHRAFLGRAVRWCVQRGITQFLDLGAGFPTVGSIHEVARRLDPTVRVVYVDVDAVAAAHARELVAGDGRLRVLQADLTAPDTVLRSPEVTGLLDLERPVAVTVTSVLHFVPDDVVDGCVAAYRSALAPGSALVLSHAVPLAGPREDEILATYRRTHDVLVPRPPEVVRALFDGFELVAPGVVEVARWPDRADGPDGDGPDGDGPDGNRPREPIGLVGGVALAPDRARRGVTEQHRG